MATTTKKTKSTTSEAKKETVKVEEVVMIPKDIDQYQMMLFRMVFRASLFMSALEQMRNLSGIILETKSNLN